MGGGRKDISGTNWSTEVVHLSKFTDFHKEINGNHFNIVLPLQIWNFLE